jgi:hypothetical protein
MPKPVALRERLGGETKGGSAKRSAEAKDLQFQISTCNQCSDVLKSIYLRLLTNVCWANVFCRIGCKTFFIYVQCNMFIDM